ncbi:hypothetical protein O6H91_20G006500 [Diphasiastrum complanatum]|uniref:Uncharacterized protein n=1 Tax=Diphasiastrum complanatum TaxID=34168 RepID=A0ACC2AMG4_DIPCM|nr:hypothetical protein O6H91_20G006500 [Diphasiastrum complanatum]
MAAKISNKLLSSWRGRQKNAEIKSSSKPPEPVWTTKSISSSEGGRESPLRNTVTYNTRKTDDNTSDSSSGSSSSPEDFEDVAESDWDSLDGTRSNSIVSSSLLHAVSTGSSSSMNTSDMQLSTPFSSQYATGVEHLSGGSSGYPSSGRYQSYGDNSSSYLSKENNPTSGHTLITPAAGASHGSSVQSFYGRSSVEGSPSGICSHGVDCTFDCSSAFKIQPLLVPNEDTASTVEEQEFNIVLNTELGALVQLEPDDFWKIATTNETLLKFLRSYLHFRKRWYDVSAPNICKRMDGMLFGDGDLSRFIFILLYRISLKEEPSVSANTAFLPYMKLLGIPTLMDICALYGHDNSELTSKLVCNMIKSEPAYEQDLVKIILRVISRSNYMQSRCSAMIKVISNACNLELSASSTLSKELFEVVDYFHDMIATIDSLLEAYPPAAKILTSAGFMNNPPGGLLSFVAGIHDLFIPILQKGLTIIVGWRKKLPQAIVDGHQKDEELEYTHFNTQLQLKRLRVRLVKLAWHLISISYLQIRGEQAYDLTLDEGRAFGACHGEEHPEKRGEELLQALATIAAGAKLDVSNSCSKKSTISGSLLYSIQARNHLTLQIAKLQENGFIALNQAQYDHVVSLLTRSAWGQPQTGSQDSHLQDVSSPCAEAQNDEHRAMVHKSKGNLSEDKLGFNNEAALSSSYGYSEEITPGVHVGQEDGTLEEAFDIKVIHAGEELLKKLQCRDVMNSEDEKGKYRKFKKQHRGAKEPKSVATDTRRWRDNLIYEDDSGTDARKKFRRRRTKSSPDEKRKFQLSSRVRTLCKEGDKDKEQTVHCQVNTKRHHRSLGRNATAVSSIEKARGLGSNDEILDGQLGVHIFS